MCRTKRAAKINELRKIRRLESFLKHRIVDCDLLVTQQTVPLLCYLQAMGTCHDNDKDIYALLIENQLPITVRRAIIEEIINRNLVSVLVECACNINNEILSSSACQIIANIVTFGEWRHFEALLQPQVFHTIFMLFRTNDERQYKCVLRLLLRALHCDSGRTQFGAIENEFFSYICNLLIHHSINIGHETGELISKLITFWVDHIDRSERQALGVHKLQIIHYLLRQFRQNEKLVAINVRCMLKLSEGTGCNEHMIAMLQCGISEALLDIIASNSAHVTLRSDILKLLCNLCKGYDENICILRKNNLLEHLKMLLATSQPKLIYREILNILFNFTGAHRSEVLAMIEINLVPEILRFIYSYDYELQMVAISIVNNVTKLGHLGDNQTMVTEGTLVALCRLLTVPDIDIVYVSYARVFAHFHFHIKIKKNRLTSFSFQITLDTINNLFNMFHRNIFYEKIVEIFENCDGFTSIELMQQHQNRDIWSLAQEFSDNFICPSNYANIVSSDCSCRSLSIDAANVRIEKFFFHNFAMSSIFNLQSDEEESSELNPTANKFEYQFNHTECLSINDFEF